MISGPSRILIDFFMIMRHLFKIILLLVIIHVFTCPLIVSAFSQETHMTDTLNDFSADEEYAQAMEFFVEVFEVMQDQYYQAIDPVILKKFIYLFNTRLYPQLKLANNSHNYIKWRSAAYLVDNLKAEEDIFSKLYPPKDAEKYEKTVLGKGIDLGIDGELVDNGYLVTWVEPRADAHDQGLRPGDIIYQIGRKNVSGLTEDDVRDLLAVAEGKKVVLYYYQKDTLAKKKIRVTSKEYFKQFAFMIPTGVDGIFCIQIERFNRKTAEDITGYMKEILSYSGKTGLIVDLRGNPGGPPLAAREISSFFLAPHQEFAYFQRRHKLRSSLDVPEIPQEYRYLGDMVILIDEDSGSASELFSGILQRKGRAVLMGANSAGQVFLKSMFPLSDDSMLLLVTARGYHPDGTVFSFGGLDPDVAIEDADDDLIRYAAQYLLKRRTGDVY